jgi:hypothetical protein
MQNTSGTLFLAASLMVASVGIGAYGVRSAILKDEQKVAQIIPEQTWNSFESIASSVQNSAERVFSLPPDSDSFADRVLGASKPIF